MRGIPTPTHSPEGVWFVEVRGSREALSGRLPRVHRTPCGDVPCSVHVGVALMSAGDTPEHRLTPAIPGRRMPAGRARPTGTGGRYLLRPPGYLLFQALNEQTPAASEDAPVQAGFLSDVPPRVLGRAPGGTGPSSDRSAAGADRRRSFASPGRSPAGPAAEQSAIRLAASGPPPAPRSTAGSAPDGSAPCPVGRPPFLLLHRQIPRKTRMPAVLNRPADLSGGRIEPKAGHANILPKGPNMHSSVEHRFLSGRKTGVSTASSR